MTTSGPSQAPLFEDGWENEPPPLWLNDPTPLMWPTPTSQLAKHGHPSPAEMARHDSLTVEVHVRPSTSSPGGIPASRSLSPGSDWARKMTAISGRQLLHLLPNSGPLAACLRTLLVTSRWGSTRCYLTWKHSVTPAGRSLFRLRPSAPPTAGIASGFSESLWPTPRASENELRSTKPSPSHLNGTHGWNLPAAIVDAASGNPHRMWPTPDAGMVTGGRTMPDGTSPTGQTPDGRKVQVGLTNAVKFLPTPTMQDGKNNGGPSQSERNTPPLNAIVGGKLSAAWVTRLMGYPDGWMDDLPVDPITQMMAEPLPRVDPFEGKPWSPLGFYEDGTPRE